MIKNENIIDKKKWTDFLHKTDNCSLSACIEYYELLKAEIFFVTAYSKDNSLIGGAICRIRGNVFPFSFFSKSIWVESGLLVDRTEGYPEQDIKGQLLKFILAEASRRHCILINFNHWSLEKNPQIFLANDYTVSYHSTFIQDLTASEEDLYSKLDRNTKAAIKKAVKANIKFRIAHKGEIIRIREFYPVYEATQERAITLNKNISMTLKPLDLLEGMLREQNLNCFFAYTTFEDKLNAGLILIQRNNTLIGYIAASDIDLNRQYGVSSLLFWNSMLWAKNQGYKYFDFGGVPTEPKRDDPAFGVYRFKKNFGGELKIFSIGSKIISPLRTKVFKKLLRSRTIIRSVMRLSNKF